MQVAEFPRWLRALFAVFLILFFFNTLYALAFFTAIWHLRLDPGIAILMGAIVGLGIVAWQARVGFTNLLRSQEHRAAIETEARQHQHILEVEREARSTDEERRVLLAALRAEIAGLMDQAQAAMHHSITMHALLDQRAAAKAPNSAKPIRSPTFNAPVYQANVSKIGLLGASLGADVVRVMTKPGISVPAPEFDRPISKEMQAKLYLGMAATMEEWGADLCHVAMRIRAGEEGTPDPGTLMEHQIKRSRANKEKQT
jgi:hypothetical protein